MKSIFLSDSDEEPIVEFVKQHEELCDKTHAKFKNKQRKEGLKTSSFQKFICQHLNKWFETQHTRYGKLTHLNSGQAVVESTERQTWLQDSFSFLRGHIRRQGVSKSSTFMSPLRPFGATATALVPDTS